MFVDPITHSSRPQDLNEAGLRTATKNPEVKEALEVLFQSVGITPDSEDSMLAVKQRALLEKIFRKMGMLKDNQLTSDEVREVSTLLKGSSSDYPAMVSDELALVKENTKELAYQNSGDGAEDAEGGDELDSREGDTEVVNDDDTDSDLRTRLESMSKDELGDYRREVRYSTSKHGNVNEFLASASDEQLKNVFGGSPVAGDAKPVDPIGTEAPVEPDEGAQVPDSKAGDSSVPTSEGDNESNGPAGGSASQRSEPGASATESRPAPTSEGDNESNGPAGGSASQRSEPGASATESRPAPTSEGDNESNGPAGASASQRSEPVASVTESRPAPTGDVVYEDGFGRLPNGTPSTGDERATRDKIGYNPLYIKGFGADSQVDGSSDQRGREAAGQVNGANDRVRVSAQDGTIKVIYPKGGNTSSHSGLQYQDQIPGTPDRDGPGEKPPLDEVTMSYKVKFEKDFPWQGGGKLPGVIASDGFGGKDDLSSLRLMWRADGKLEFYIHTPHEDRTRLPFNNVDGTHATAPDGEWMDVQIRVKLNTVKNGVPQADGVLEAWINGKRVAFYDDVKIRGNEDTNINSMFFSTFYGGSSGDGSTQWWPPRDSSAEFKDVTITK